MSNLYKGHINQNRQDVYTRVIDHNELLEQKLSAITFEQITKLRQQQLEEFRRQQEQAAENGEDADDDGTDTEDGEAVKTAKPAFTEGILGTGFAGAPSGMEIDYIEHAKEEASRVIAKAAADAQAILTKAAEEAENLKESARKQAEEQGYAQAMERVQEQEAQMREQLDALARQQEQDYADKLEQMEPMLMDAVIRVFDEVLHADFAGRKKILLHLIYRTVRNIKNSREFRIRVSGGDYEAVAGAKEDIYQKIGGEVTLDIIMDESMQQGACMIDTDEGIFECGLDIQFENLIKDLKALSCMD